MKLLVKTNISCCFFFAISDSFPLEITLYFRERCILPIEQSRAIQDIVSIPPPWEFEGFHSDTLALPINCTGPYFPIEAVIHIFTQLSLKIKFFLSQSQC